MLNLSIIDQGQSELILNHLNKNLFIYCPWSNQRKHWFSSYHECIKYSISLSFIYLQITPIWTTIITEFSVPCLITQRIENITNTKLNFHSVLNFLLRIMNRHHTVSTYSPNFQSWPWYSSDCCLVGTASYLKTTPITLCSYRTGVVCNTYFVIILAHFLPISC
jgi:hypothetical protein